MRRSAGVTPSASAIFERKRSVGFSSPRSTPDRYRVAIPASSASCSCVSPRALRSRRMFFPTICSQSITRWSGNRHNSSRNHIAYYVEDRQYRSCWRSILMRLEIADFDLHLTEQNHLTGARRGPGWFWQEVRLPPVGPFASMREALQDLFAKIESGDLGKAVAERSTERPHQTAPPSGAPGRRGLSRAHASPKTKNPAEAGFGAQKRTRTSTVLPAST